MGVSTHILNIEQGRPAAGVKVMLERLREADRWTPLRTDWTDADGRCRQMLDEGAELTTGVYRLRFATGVYFAEMGAVGLYPWVEIAFEVRDAHEHFHVPLLLTANGYTTYRGS